MIRTQSLLVWFVGSILLLFAIVCVDAEVVTVLDLGGNWRFNQDDSASSLAATVPGCVHLDLLAAGRIPDPFYGDNQKLLQWVGDSTWTYTRSITLTPELYARKHILLRCEGLDTICSIFINDLPVASTDNMFRTYEFEIRKLLKPGDNRIKIRFDPVGPYIKRFITESHGPMSSVRGMGNIRKAPYSGGWDFGPKFLTCGIYRKIALLAFDEGRLTQVAAATKIENDGAAIVNVDASAQLDNPSASAVATLTLSGALVATQSAPVDGGSFHFQLPVSKPKLWWPAGMGAQPLYNLVVTLKDGAGTTIDSKQSRIGLRRIELLPKTDIRPLRLAVNGRELFAKGVDWIPSDMFAPRVTPAKLRQYVTDVATTNMNMIRCWGGGYYEEDDFYDACDEMGILVWFEFKFACSVYPSGNPRFVDNVRAEVIDQVNRLRNHPSIAVWCGNNEVMSLITGYKVLKQADYDALFHGVIGATVQSLIPQANYVGGSPEAGDEHNWWVWHVGANFEKYFDSHGWMTEFGFQSFPCPATVNSFTRPEDRVSVLSPVMKAHQHNGNGRGNEMIVEMMGRYFHPAKDFESTLWLSQINQAYGITMGIEHWRSDWPRSSGSLVWQLDDCWPGATWSSIDYFGRWKALQYKLRQAYAPLMVTGRYNARSSQVDLNVCSDLASACSAKVKWNLSDTRGAILRTGTFAVSVPAGTCSVTCPPLLLDDAIAAIGRRNALLWIDLENAEGRVVSQKVLWFVRPKNLAITDPKISSSITEVGSEYAVTLTTDRPALWAWIDIDGDPDARYSDNFIHLAAGAPAVIQIAPSKPVTGSQLASRLRVRSLFDTFAPGAAAELHAATQAADGSIVATADQAEIIGNSARLEKGKPSNIGGWTDPGDELDWTFQVDHPGSYRVSLDVACPPNVQGSEIVLNVGTARVTGIVPMTGGWKKYQMLDLGIVQLEKIGPVNLSLVAVKIPHGNAMNLRSVTLRPTPVQ